MFCHREVVLNLNTVQWLSLSYFSLLSVSQLSCFVLFFVDLIWFPFKFWDYGPCVLGKNSDAQFIISFQRSKGKCNLLTKSKETKPILKDAMDFVFCYFIHQLPLSLVFTQVFMIILYISLIMYSLTVSTLLINVIVMKTSDEYFYQLCFIIFSYFLTHFIYWTMFFAFFNLWAPITLVRARARAHTRTHSYIHVSSHYHSRD